MTKKAGPFDAIKASMENTKKLIEQQGKKALQSVFADFFAEHPEITGVQWSQYTPYFNDGEPCIFSIHDAYFKLAPSADEEDDEEWKDSYHFNDSVRKELDTWWNGMSGDAGEGVFLAVFGDHVQVTADGKKFKVEEYDHD